MKIKYDKILGKPREQDGVDGVGNFWPIQVLTDCAMFDDDEGRYTRLDDEIATVKAYNGVRRSKK